MEGLNLNVDLFRLLSSKDYLRAGFQRVKRNKGVAGIDGVTIEEFEQHLEQEITELHQELREWSYTPMPVKRVTIPKPGTTKVRILGIPSIRDRVLYASIKMVIEPLFEEGFSETSYGFRPGRSQKQAVAQACKIIESGKTWTVDIDLENFFDEINQD